MGNPSSRLPESRSGLRSTRVGSQRQKAYQVRRILQHNLLVLSGSQPLITIAVSPETSLRAGRSVRTWHYGPSRGPASLQAFMTLFMMFIMNINILIDISSTVA